MDVPNVLLKAIVFVHFILSVFGSMGDQAALPLTYTYVSAVVVACGVWAIASSESSDALFMTAATLLISILVDILLLALYAPRAHDRYRDVLYSITSAKNEYRFALGHARRADSSYSSRAMQRRVNSAAGTGGRSQYSNIDHQAPPAYNTPSPSGEPVPPSNNGTGGRSQYSNIDHQVPPAYNATSPSGEPVPPSNNA